MTHWQCSGIFLLLSALTAAAPSRAAEEPDCKGFFERLEAKFLGVGETQVKTVGGNLTITAENEGKPLPLLFADNAEPHPFDYYSSFTLDIPHENLKAGFSFQGPDQKKWAFESIDALGNVQFRSGTEKLNWRSGYLAAHSYKARIGATGHEIKVLIPALPDGGQDLAMLERIRSVIAHMPEKSASSVETIRMHSLPNVEDKIWQKNYSHHLHWYNFWRKLESEATSGNRELNFFPSARRLDILQAGRHELGHLIAESLYGSAVPDTRWLAAMEADGAVASNYARNNAAEDFAETVRLYLETDAGAGDRTLGRPAYRKLRARFALLDEIFGIRPGDSRKKADRARNIRRILAGFGVVSVGSEAYTLIHLGTPGSEPGRDSAGPSPQPQAGSKP